MREEEIVQIIPAQGGWYAHGRDEHVRHVVGLPAHGSGSVERVEESPGFVEYHYVSESGAP